MREIEKSFTSEKCEVSYPVVTQHENMRLDLFLMCYMPNVSREFLKKKIEKGEIIISGRTPPHKSSVKVHFGERVTVITYNDGVLEDELWQGKPVPRDQEPGILFEDKNLLVINKPPFMLTHPAGKNLFYCATVFFENIYKHAFYSFHRIDRETSGILMLAKNVPTAQRLSVLFEQEKVHKYYFFIAHKTPNAKAFPFTARQRMGPNENLIPQGMISAYPEDSNLEKDAETHFELLLEKDNFVLALAFPKTGRQHQIRVHAACNGYPLLGEKLYNGDSQIFMRFKNHQATEEDHQKMQIPRHALHAAALKLSYPQENETQFIAPLPQDLSQWIEAKFAISISEVEKLMETKIKTFLL